MRDELAAAGEPAPRVMRRGSAWFVTLTLLLVARGPASAQAIGQGVELERAGQFEQAASIYFSTLSGASPSACGTTVATTGGCAVKLTQSGLQ